MGARRAFVGLGVVALAIGGCTGDSGDDAPPEAGSAEDTEKAPTGAATTDDGDEVDGEVDDPDVGPDSEGQAPAPPDTAPALATVTHEVPGVDGITLDVDLLTMAIAGELLRVDVAFTGRWAADPDLTLAQLLGAGPHAPAAGIDLRLLDPVNLLEYTPVRPSLPNGQSVFLTADEPLVVRFYFGAPIETPETFDVHLDVALATTTMPPLTDVPYEPA